MNKIFTAQEAKKLAAKYKKPEISDRQLFILEKIKERSKKGYTYLIFDEAIRLQYSLQEDDFLFFQKLGFQIQKPKQTDDMYYYGVINW